MPPNPNRVVVAEDETLIRLLAADMLAEEGFEVIEAGHAQEALAALHAQSHAIILLFTDIHMPGEMDGLALAHHGHNTWPHIALLITSGEANPAPHQLPTRSVFVAKPYDLDHIKGHVHALTAG